MAESWGTSATMKLIYVMDVSPQYSFPVNAVNLDLDGAPNFEFPGIRFKKSARMQFLWTFRHMCRNVTARHSRRKNDGFGDKAN